MDMEFLSRLEQLIGDTRPYTWASDAGISKGAFRRIYKEGIVPGPDILRRIKRHTGASLDWIVDGDGPIPECVRARSAERTAEFLSLVEPMVAEDAPRYAPKPLSTQAALIAGALERDASRVGVALTVSTIVEFAVKTAQSCGEDWSRIEVAIAKLIEAYGV